MSFFNKNDRIWYIIILEILEKLLLLINSKMSLLFVIYILR